jgi:hypothetical protein
MTEDNTAYHHGSVAAYNKAYRQSVVADGNAAYLHVVSPKTMLPLAMEA